MPERCDLCHTRPAAESIRHEDGRILRYCADCAAGYRESYAILARYKQAPKTPAEAAGDQIRTDGLFDAL